MKKTQRETVEWRMTDDFSWTDPLRMSTVVRLFFPV